MQTIKFNVDLFDAPHYRAINDELGDAGQTAYLQLCVRLHDSGGNLGAAGPAEIAELGKYRGTTSYDAMLNGFVAAGAITLLDDGTVQLTDYNKWCPADGPEGTDVARCPVRKIIALYHEHLPMLPQVRMTSATTEGNIRARWREQPERQDLQWWVDYFKYVAKCPFLIGEVQARPGQRPFQANLQWIVRPTNMEKIVNGNYDP